MTTNGSRVRYRCTGRTHRPHRPIDHQYTRLENKSPDQRSYHTNKNSRCAADAQVKLHTERVESLRNEVTRLEQENLATLARLFQCTIEDLRLCKWALRWALSPHNVMSCCCITSWGCARGLKGMEQMALAPIHIALLVYIALCPHPIGGTLLILSIPTLVNEYNYW